MRSTLIALAALVLLSAACVTGDGSDPEGSLPVGPPADGSIGERACGTVAEEGRSALGACAQALPAVLVWAGDARLAGITGYGIQDDGRFSSAGTSGSYWRLTFVADSLPDRAFEIQVSSDLGVEEGEDHLVLDDTATAAAASAFQEWGVTTDSPAWFGQLALDPSNAHQPYTAVAGADPDCPVAQGALLVAGLYDGGLQDAGIQLHPALAPFQGTCP